ncbi:hypothetical protein F4561_000901 [Lipingzhangella halophila]|uniref:Uncharacterized protein n=1 Tax=Lipingzhangella halophila TaxID=1783352 RepID=A0A7W7RDP1_9ACTN|nr:hypothetical protein [Lipingzhangella halophila]
MLVQLSTAIIGIVFLIIGIILVIAGVFALLVGECFGESY